ncbi:MAG TPA: cysteine desulfurase-like protein [Thermoanaerobaculia bacterium]|jgi:cysteine desulfurase family protein (TIGR01976 family)|nr:cysteine desulfurase-like protein [Thermoanaerobaculia bacterium]
MNIDHIRSQFPALARTHNGERVAYFDAPGGTQVPRSVADAMSDYLLHHNANTHWHYPTSAETDAIITGAREAAADLLNGQPNEIAFGANMTTLTFHLARALGRTWSEGDEVIVTELDHHANIAPWRALEIDRGIVVRTARMICDTAQLDYEHLASLVNDRTKLIAIGGASNATGTINDLQRVTKIARDAGVYSFVDAVHLTPHELIDVQAIGCDFLACSSYKFYGPHAGILWGRFSLLDTLPFPKLAPAPDYAPERVETGTQNHEAIAGIGATIEFLASIGGKGGTRRERLERGYADLHAAGLRLTQQLWDGLTSLPNVKVYGPPPSQPRTPTVSFRVDGMDSHDVARKLTESAIFASSGDFYASTVCDRYGIENLLRVGCGCYTTDTEVARLLAAVAAL